MKTALIPSVARLAAGLVPGAVAAPGKVNRGFPDAQPEERRFRFEGKGAGTPKSAGCFGARPVPVPGEGNRTAGRRAS